VFKKLQDFLTQVRDVMKTNIKKMHPKIKVLIEQLDETLQSTESKDIQQKSGIFKPQPFLKHENKRLYDEAEKKEKRNIIPLCE